MVAHLAKVKGKRSGSLSLILRTAIAFCAVTILLVACRDVREGAYSSLPEADRDGAIGRGWIPDFLPKSSYNIREVHDLENSMGWCAFDFVPGDSDTLRVNLNEKSEPVPASVLEIPNPRVRWWPAVLQDDVSVQAVKNAGFELYIVMNQETSTSSNLLLFAIDWQKGRGYFYRVSH